MINSSPSRVSSGTGTASSASSNENILLNDNSNNNNQEIFAANGQQGGVAENLARIPHALPLLPNPFKDQLLAQHLKITTKSSSQQDNDSDVRDIDPRVRSQSSNDNHNTYNLIQTKLGPGPHQAHQFRSSSEDRQSMYLPAKLSSTLQRQDKKPFAYTAEVNDPNNRGKLDLSQIKSPAMKRRLLANMASSEERDENLDENLDENSYQNSNQESSVSDTNRSPIDDTHHHSSEHKSKIVWNPSAIWDYNGIKEPHDAGQTPIKETLIKETTNKNNYDSTSKQAEHVIEYQARKPSFFQYNTSNLMNNNANLHQPNQDSTTNEQPPRVLYHPKTIIKRTNYQTTDHFEINTRQQQQQEQTQQQQGNTSTNRNTIYNTRQHVDNLDELGFEVERSLQSLEELVSNMGLDTTRTRETTDSNRTTNTSRGYQPRNRDEFQDKGRIRYHEPRGSIYHHYDSVRNFTDPTSRYTTGQQMITNTQPKVSIGNFLLAPDTRYFEVPCHATQGYQSGLLAGNYRQDPYGKQATSYKRFV